MKTVTLKTITETQALVKTQEKQVSSLTKAAEKLTVKSDEDYAKAAQFVSELKKNLKSIDAARHTITDPIDQAKKATMALFKPMTNALEASIATVDTKIVGYLDEKAKVAQKAVAREAKSLERKGLPDMAKDVMKKAAADVIPEVAGTFIRSTWHAQLTDMRALLEAVVAGTAPADFIMFNEKYANGIARLVKDATKAPQGVKYIEEKFTQSGGPNFGGLS